MRVERHALRFAVVLVVACGDSSPDAADSSDASGPPETGSTDGGPDGSPTSSVDDTAGDDDVTSSSSGDEDCVATSCNGHGVCVESDSSIECTCDEGFVGDDCEARGDDFHRRTLLVGGLADPDVFEENDDEFYLVGTGSTVTVPIYRSTDLLTFAEHRQFDPSVLDPAHDYCWIWAPDLSKYDGTYDLYFSAHRVAKGAACPPAAQSVTTFHASAPSTEFEFGIPELVNDGTALPHGTIDPGCPVQGCSSAIRIDSAAYDDGVDRWFSYVWFDGGNNIASFRYGDPQALVLNAGPAVFATAPFEESINEAPDVFLRDARYYMFFSAGFFDSQYAMYYLVSDDVADLTRARNVRRHSEPLRSADGDLVESHGHNSIVERRGEFFNVFHVGEFDGAGSLTGRSTHKQRIAFAADGSIVALNYVDVRWSRVAGAAYSLDIVMRDGAVIGPCIAVGTIGDATAARWGGICPDAADVRVEKADVAAFRVYHSVDGTWTQFADAAYDGAADRVFAKIAGGTTDAVDIRWNELATGAEYSLDVQRTDATWVAPCVGAPTLGTRIGHLYPGACTSTADVVAPADIQAFRVCSAQNGDWANATCGTTPYDGEAGHLDVVIP